MKIKVVRKWFTEASTIGELHVDGEFCCFTLEDKVRPAKVWGKTAIPAGTYPVVVSYSPRFQKQLPLLLNVPNFVGIRIHSGNSAADTEGCILVGETKGPDFVGNSRSAFNKLFEKITAAARSTKITLEVG